jgi:hypothetical protein
VDTSEVRKEPNRDHHLEMDRGYTILLFHLNRPSTDQPLQSITASLSHYLSSLPSPTPLTAITISSPFFTPTLSHTELSALSTAFRHAVHLKHRSLIDDQPGIGLGTLFSRGVKVRLRDWVRDVLKGLEGGMGVLRLACAGGILTGLGDLEGVGKLKAGSGEAGRGRVEDEVVVALAEVMELHESAAHGGGWEKEFQPVTGQGDGMQACLLCSFKYTYWLLYSRRSPDTRIPLPPSNPNSKT